MLYVERAAGIDAAAHEAALKAAIAALQESHPGVGMRRTPGADGRWAVTVPEKYDVGYEAHFAAVMDRFLRYLRAGKLPDWEVPNMLTKYATIMQAYELSHQAPRTVSIKARRQPV